MKAPIRMTVPRAWGASTTTKPARVPAEKPDRSKVIARQWGFLPKETR